MVQPTAGCLPSLNQLSRILRANKGAYISALLTNRLFVHTSLKHQVSIDRWIKLAKNLNSKIDRVGDRLSLSGFSIRAAVGTMGIENKHNRKD